MDTPLSRENPKVGELQMDWLRSEDLKEEKNVIAPIAIIAAHCALSLPAVQGLPLTMIGIRLACPDSDSLDEWEAADDDGDENEDGYSE